MNSKIEDLEKFLNLEISRNYDNRSILGGFQKLIPIWKNDQTFTELDSVFYSSIIFFLQNYSSWKLSERKTKLLEILNTIKSNQNKNNGYLPQKKITKEVQEKNSEYLTPQSTTKGLNRKTGSNNNRPIDLKIKSSLRSLNQIGKSREIALNDLGIFTIEDLIYFFPRKYVDFRTIKTIDQLNYGDQVTLIASVKSISTHKSKNRKISITEVIIDDGTDSIRINFFNQPFLERQLKKEELISIKGKVDRYLGRLVINSPIWEQIDQQTEEINGILPIYKIPEGFSQKSIRKIIIETLNLWKSQIIDYLPATVMNESNLMDLNQAILECHLPSNFENLEKAKYRIFFDQIFFLQMGVLGQKNEWNKRVSEAIEIPNDFLSNIYTNLPFKLTEGQISSIKDIEKDFISGKPMNRLIQGDVGSGKTMVAFIAMAMVLSKKSTQVAFMAPTSILASQQFKSALSFFEKNKVINLDQITLLLGDTSAKDKETIRTNLRSGKIRLIFGTHALIEDSIIFNNLKFVVIDEQHRFGVDQRKQLTEKGPSSHLLVMTATPIPRSLALTIFGDLDLSIMKEMPVGRIPVNTQILKSNERNRVYKFISANVAKGKQAFIVYPLVESQDNIEEEISNAAVNEFARLKNEVFKGLDIALLHGKMKPIEKEKVMIDYYNGIYQILVSTTVIEVGVDVPNASIMVIEGANRFGLAQLHQLRGRVGRDKSQAYCFLIPENEDSYENERLKALQESNDGFALAEIDLQQRGPGDFLGQRQSGFKELQLMNIMNVELIEKARFFAENIFSIDPNLEKSENQEMKKFLNYYWNKTNGDKN